MSVKYNITTIIVNKTLKVLQGEPRSFFGISFCKHQYSKTSILEENTDIVDEREETYTDGGFSVLCQLPPVVFNLQHSGQHGPDPWILAVHLRLSSLKPPIHYTE